AQQQHQLSSLSRVLHSQLPFPDRPMYSASAIQPVQQLLPVPTEPQVTPIYGQMASPVQLLTEYLQAHILLPLPTHTAVLQPHRLQLQNLVLPLQLPSPEQPMCFVTAEQPAQQLLMGQTELPDIPTYGQMAKPMLQLPAYQPQPILLQLLTHIVVQQLPQQP
ncbi:MAG: hypothetical protein WCK63_19115, partial [Betaproteobacteria bacterium]